MLKVKLYILLEMMFIGLAISCIFHIICILIRIPEVEPNLIIKFFEVIVLISSFIYFMCLLVTKSFKLIQVKGGKKDQKNVRNKETS